MMLKAIRTLAWITGSLVAAGFIAFSAPVAVAVWQNKVKR